MRFLVILSVLFSGFISRTAISADLQIIERAWSNNLIEVVQFDWLKNYETGNWHMQNFGWRKKAANETDSKFFPLYSNGHSGSYSGGNFFLNHSLTTTTHSHKDFGSPKDSFRLVTTPDYLYLSGDYFFSAVELSRVESLDRMINDGKIQVEEFPSKKRILYFAMRTKDDRYILTLDLPYPTRNHEHAEVIIKDLKENRTYIVSSKNIERVYCNGDGNIYVLGKTPEGKRFEVYWPSITHRATLDRIRESHLQPGEFSTEPMIDHREGSIVVDFSESIPSSDARKHFLYSVGRDPFFKFGSESFRFDDIEEITDGKEPRAAPGFVPERYQSLIKVAGLMDLNWQERFGDPREGDAGNSIDYPCNEILKFIGNQPLPKRPIY